MMICFMISTSLTQTMVDYMQNPNRHINPDEGEVLNHLIQSHLFFRERVQSLSLTKSNEKTRDMVKDILIRYQIPLQTISSFVEKSLVANLSSTETEVQGLGTAWNTNKLRNESLNVLCTALSSYSVVQVHNDVVVVDSMKKEKGTITAKPADLINIQGAIISDKFGAFSHVTRYDGSAADLVTVLGNCCRIMLLQSNSYMEKLIESRVQAPTDETTTHEENQNYIFVTLW